jgi:hypothetical protein
MVVAVKGFGCTGGSGVESFFLLHENRIQVNNMKQVDFIDIIITKN